MGCNLFQTCVFLVFVLGVTPNHIPLKYGSPLDTGKQIRHVFLKVLNADLKTDTKKVHVEERLDYMLKTC